MVPTTLPVSENTVLVDMKLCTKPHGFMWTSMASKVDTRGTLYSYSI